MQQSRGNAPIRGDLLDTAVWGEVRALLEEPERLKMEYQRRLENSDQEARQADLALLERQISRVRQGIGRLIDSYAEGLIDKGEFEPRITRLKERVAHLETQAHAQAQAATQERELRLVIGQLADYAASLRNRLDHLEWATRQAILRALVKRVEIDHEQVQVVFRVGPGPILPDPHPPLSQDCEGRGRGCGDETTSHQRLAPVELGALAVEAFGPGVRAYRGYRASPDPLPGALLPRRRARIRSGRGCVLTASSSAHVGRPAWEAAP